MGGIRDLDTNLSTLNKHDLKLYVAENVDNVDCTLLYN